jgi:outer membrane immunogenic protein
MSLHRHVSHHGAFQTFGIGAIRAMGVRRLAVALLASAALSAPALAADLAIGGEPLPPISGDTLDPTFTWTGAYAGVTGGYAFGKDRTTEFLGGAYVQQFELKPEGWTVGGVAGYNLQYDNFVFGVEADGGFADIHDGFMDPPGAPPFVGDPGATGDVNVKWQASARLRAGYAFDRALVFVAGGWAVAGITTEFSNQTTLVREAFKDTRQTWTLGGGFEYAFSDLIIGRLEYRYTPFPDVLYTSVTAFPGFGITATQKPALNEVRTGVTVKF